jgi:hypothetical protein
MQVIYRTDDGQEFKDKKKALTYENLALIYENLAREKVSIPIKPTTKEVISPKCLKQIFDIGSIYGMTLLLKDEKGNIYEDSSFETWSLDETEHLDCTDYSHGLLEWSEEDNTYYWTRHFVSQKVELIGIVNVIYI